MFTGIILAIGKIAVVEPKNGDFRLKVDTGVLSLHDCALGDSIAVNGVCLTVVERDTHYFCADVSNETLTRTTLGKAFPGTRVNIELALTPSTRMGGHIVSGHVDGIAVIVEKQSDARSIRFTFKAPDHLAKYITEKGSICINGISLTVNSVNGAVFNVNVIPHTLEKTTLQEAAIGTPVNMEVDLLARYMERLLRNDTTHENNNHLTEDFLQKAGFL